MSCMECLHAHIPSHSPTPSHMPMTSVTTVIASTNDTHILSPYRLTNTKCKCQWATHPESIPTPITKLEVYVITVCLFLGNRTFRITPWVSYTHVPGFSPKRINDPLLALPNTRNYILLYALNHESYFGRCLKYELTTHSSTLMMDDHTDAHTPNMLTSLCICNVNVTVISHVTCFDAHYMNHSHQLYFMSITMQTYITSI